MKIKKAIQQKFFKDATNLLVKYSAEKVDFIGNEYFELNTVFGKLLIKVDKDSSYLFTVFMRFETFDDSFYKFFSRHEINNHSFKWNLHSEDGEYILNELEERLDNLVYTNKVIRISDALNERIEDIMDWREEKINETFNSLYKLV